MTPVTRRAPLDLLLKGRLSAKRLESAMIAVLVDRQQPAPELRKRRITADGAVAVDPHERGIGDPDAAARAAFRRTHLEVRPGHFCAVVDPQLGIFRVSFKVPLNER